VKNDNDRKDDADWEFGDVWKEGSPDQAPSDEDVTYSEILRGDTGSGFDDSFLVDLIGYLGSRGIRATFDSFSIGMEPAAIKTYVLKVELGKEEEAREYLQEKSGGRSS
jgi:hypothetical protein